MRPGLCCRKREGREPGMTGLSENADYGRVQQSPQELPRFLLLGTVLQLALRIVLVVFIAVTLMSEPPNKNLTTCAAVLTGYALLAACWSAWALRTAPRASQRIRTLVTVLMLAADVAVVSVLAVVTGLTAPDDWTSN